MKMKEVRHPGEILREDYLRKRNERALRISEATGINPGYLSGIINGYKRITVPVSLALGEYYNENPRVWLKRQMEYDLYIEQGKKQRYGAVHSWS